jgi:NADH-quinone oxidoreductase subunit L
MFIATLAIAGIPGLSGFFSKDEILWKAYSSPHGHWAFWLAGILGAGITAFYMFRLVFLAFFGECRADKETKHHIHESPRVMTIPLIVLAFLSVVGGWIGVPEVLKGGNQFHHYLAPVVSPEEAHGKTLLDWDVSAETGGAPLVAAGPHAAESHAEKPPSGDAPHHEAAAAEAPEAPVHETGARSADVHGAAAHGASHTTELLLMVLSVLVALFGIGLAHRLYRTHPEIPGRIALRARGLHRIVENKYYVDELYGATVIRFVLLLSQWLRRFDDLVIDGLVNLSGWIVRIVSVVSGWFDNTFVDGLVNALANGTVALGARARRLQTGAVQSYVIAVFGGILLLVILYLSLGART